jgi:hypothetical protein
MRLITDRPNAEHSSQILKDATLYFSHGTPNLPTVIPAMDHIDTTFMNATLPGSKNHPAVRAAIKITKHTLNKYYSLMDSSEVYRIAMGRFMVYFVFYCLIVYFYCSTPPSSQTRILRSRRMGSRLDQHSESSHSRPIQVMICHVANDRQW